MRHLCLTVAFVSVVACGGEPEPSCSDAYAECQSAAYLGCGEADGFNPEVCMMKELDRCAVEFYACGSSASTDG